MSMRITIWSLRCFLFSRYSPTLKISPCLAEYPTPLRAALVLFGSTDSALLSLGSSPKISSSFSSSSFSSKMRAFSPLIALSRSRIRGSNPELIAVSRSDASLETEKASDKILQLYSTASFCFYCIYLSCDVGSLSMILKRRSFQCLFLRKSQKKKGIWENDSSSFSHKLQLLRDSSFFHVFMNTTPEEMSCFTPPKSWNRSKKVFFGKY